MKDLCMKRGLYSDRTSPPAGLLPFDSLIPSEVGSAGRSATMTLLYRLKTHFTAYIGRVAFIITSNKHTIFLFLTSKNSLI